MELRQLLCPEVLRWHKEHAHLNEEDFFNEYGKWFKENIQKINESVENNSEKINECINKGKKMSKNRHMLLEAMTLDDDDDEVVDDDDEVVDDDDEVVDDDDEVVDDDVVDDEVVDDDVVDDDVVDDDEVVDDDDEVVDDDKVVVDDDKVVVDDDDEVVDDDDEEEIVDEDDVVDAVEKMEKILDSPTTKGIPEDLIINLSNENLYEVINTAFITLEEGVDGVSMLSLPNKYFWGSMNTKGVSDMTALFAFAYMPNADLSLWDTSNVKSMEGMFYKAKFNSDSILDWTVNNCICFDNMFLFSSFNHNVSHWDTGKIETIKYDKDGRVVMDEKTKKPKKVFKRVPPPIVGANKNEKEERKMRAWVDRHKKNLKTSMTLSENKNNMKYILDFETFINEGFGDFIKKGINKVKSFFKTFAIKLGDYIKIYDSDGNSMDVNSPYSSLNLISTGSIKGVTAFSKVKNEYLNNNIKSIAEIVGDPEYYGITDKNSLEYKNYLTMIGKIEEHYNKHKGELNKLNESDIYDEDEYERVGLSAKSGGLSSVEDINSYTLEEKLNEIIRNVPGNKRKGNSALIWGSPGIGKTTIPNAVINNWNKNNPDQLKSIMVIKCHNLTVDGFSIPMPIQKSMGRYLSEHPETVERIKALGPEYVKKLEDKEFLDKLFDVSDDLPKTWLPAYRLTPNKEENKVRNEIANGHVFIKETDIEGLDTIETTEGGIILFDEFLRANAQVFPILMDILLEREWSGYRLGNKWGLIACSNRPGDDNSIVYKLDRDSSPVTFNRFAQYNFIPSFIEWKDWALKYGNFDNLTIAFLQRDIDAKSGEYKNWHTISKDAFAKGYTAWPTPRSWSLAMNDIYLYKLDHDGKITYGKIREIVNAYVGKTTTDKYIKFIKSRNKEKTEVFNAKLYLTNSEYMPTKYKYEEDGTIKDRDLYCSEVTEYLTEYICSAYSESKQPKDEDLMMMFNKIEKQFSSMSNQKYLNTMYTKIIRDFIGIDKLSIEKEDYFSTIFKPRLNKLLKKLPNFIEAIALKYSLVNSEGKLVAKKVYEWLNI